LSWRLRFRFSLTRLSGIFNIKVGTGKKTELAADRKKLKKIDFLP
jgi:hypothetical protein